MRYKGVELLAREGRPIEEAAVLFYYVGVRGKLGKYLGTLLICVVVLALLVYYGKCLLVKFVLTNKSPGLGINKVDQVAGVPLLPVKHAI